MELRKITYAHGDWKLNNILKDGKELKLVDWDCLDIHDPKWVQQSIYIHLAKGFGSKRVLKYFPDDWTIDENDFQIPPKDILGIDGV